MKIDGVKITIYNNLTNKNTLLKRSVAQDLLSYQSYSVPYSMESLLGIYTHKGFHGNIINYGISS